MIIYIVVVLVFTSNLSSSRQFSAGSAIIHSHAAWFIMIMSPQDLLIEFFRHSIVPVRVKLHFM